MKIDSFIDYSLIDPQITKDDVIKACAQARAYKFASVSVNPIWTKLVSDELNGSTTTNCTMIAYPLGALPLQNKIAEVITAKENGATDFEVVLDMSAIKTRNRDFLLNEINSISLITKENKIKVVIENALLDESDREFICQLINETNVKYLVTSTGFFNSNIDEQAIKQYVSLLNNDKNIKAVGSLNSYSDCLKMIDAGASRIGTSNAVAIVREEQEADERTTNEEL